MGGYVKYFAPALFVWKPEVKISRHSSLISLTGGGDSQYFDLWCLPFLFHVGSALSPTKFYFISAGVAIMHRAL